MYWMITFREEQRNYMESGHPRAPPRYRTAVLDEHPLDWLARLDESSDMIDKMAIMFAMEIDAATYAKHKDR